jgi:hypothetical protein
MGLLKGLFGGQPTAFRWTPSTYRDVNKDNAAAESFLPFGPNLTPPFEPEDGQGRTWGGQHVRGDLYLTSPGLLTLAKATPLYDFDQIAVPNLDEIQAPLMLQEGSNEPILDTELPL